MSTAKLVGDDGRTYELRGEVRIGRSADCDIAIQDEKVSRCHAVVRFSGDAATVEDAGSTNGTWVNGQRIEKATKLGHGDTVRVHRHSFRLLVDQGEAAVDGCAGPASTSKPATPAHAAHPYSTRVLRPIAGAARASELAHLMLLGPNARGDRVFELPLSGAKRDLWTIGRDDDCEIKLTADSISGRHAQLAYENSRWRLADLDSANGTFVNGEEHITAFLADEDEVEIGLAKLTFRTAIGDQTPTLADARLQSSVRRQAALWLFGVIVVAALGFALWWMGGP